MADSYEIINSHELNLYDYIQSWLEHRFEEESLFLKNTDLSFKHTHWNGISL